MPLELQPRFTRRSIRGRLLAAVAASTLSCGTPADTLGDDAASPDSAPPEADSHAEAGDARDSLADSADDVASDALDDADPSEDAVGERPPPDAPCERRLDYIVGYSAAHDACAADEECTNALPVTTVAPDLLCWVDIGDWLSPGTSCGVRVDAMPPDLRDYAQRAASCCGPSVGGTGWACRCVADAAAASLAPSCERGHCVAYVLVP